MEVWVGIVSVEGCVVVSPLVGLISGEGFVGDTVGCSVAFNIGFDVTSGVGRVVGMSSLLGDSVGIGCMVGTYCGGLGVELAMLLLG